MSSAFALVRFPGGRVRAGVYHGTSDVLHPWLWDSIEEAWDHRRGPDKVMRDWYEPPEGVTYDVTVFSDYGRGFYWPAHAAWNVVLDNLMPYEDCHKQMTKGGARSGSKRSSPPFRTERAPGARSNPTRLSHRPL